MENHEIVNFPMSMVMFHSYVNVYQRVMAIMAIMAKMAIMVYPLVS
jgi:hypothetical protein